MAMTIKAVGRQGDEAVFQAAYLIKNNGREKGSLGVLEFYNDGHGTAWQPIHYGKVFVMNEAGKTVAKYELDDPTVEM